MNAVVARHLQELRESMDAEFYVIEDDGRTILVSVVPSDLPPFLLRIDPKNCAHAACH